MSSAKYCFQAAPHDPRERLDKLVMTYLERSSVSASRAAVQRWIEHGRVLVDGKASKSAASIHSGALVEIDPEPPPPSAATPDPSIVLHVVYEDEDLLIIDKAAGLVVHPARGHADKTLVNALLARGDFLISASSGDDSSDEDEGAHLRPGIVHRLDKGTSGLLAVAKNEAAREALKTLFQEHNIEREYIALVNGQAKDATIETLHGRHPKDRLRFTSFVQQGKRAVTHIRVLERFGTIATLVACTLETGRTHQIRVHLAERMHTPIVGDPLYGKEPRDPLLRQIAAGLGHQALHARALGFLHPRTHKAMHWESAPPADIQRALDTLHAAAAATKSST